MKKLTYGMVGGGPGSFIGDAHRKSINIDAMATLTAGCFSRTLEKTLERLLGMPCAGPGATMEVASAAWHYRIGGDEDGD